MLPNRIFLGVRQCMGLGISIMTHLYQCSILYNSVAALKVLSVVYPCSSPAPESHSSHCHQRVCLSQIIIRLEWYSA